MNNYDFLSSLLTTIPDDVRAISLSGYAIAIIISLAVSLLISGLYVTYFDPNSTGSKIHRSFPLLGMAVNTIFITVQFSLPLSLGLLGALSIVRFRTPIKEPEEIGFILLVIACSISIATFNIAIAALLFFVTFLFLFTFNKMPNFSWLNSNSATLSLLIIHDEASDETEIDDIKAILSHQNLKYRISSIHSDTQQTSLSVFIKNLSDDDLGIVPAIKAQNSNITVDVYRK